MIFFMKEYLDFKELFLIYSHRGSVRKIPYEEILSIECDKPYVEFRLKNSKHFSVKTSLLEIQKNLNLEFLRVNRQIIVNMKNAQFLISDAKGCWIQMEDNLRYQISVRLQAAVRVAFCLYVGE